MEEQPAPQGPRTRSKPPGRTQAGPDGRAPCSNFRGASPSISRAAVHCALGRGISARLAAFIHCCADCRRGCHGTPPTCRGFDASGVPLERSANIAHAHVHHAPTAQDRDSACSPPFNRIGVARAISCGLVLIGRNAARANMALPFERLETRLLWCCRPVKTRPGEARDSDE